MWDMPGVWWGQMMADAQQLSGDWALALVGKIFGGLALLIGAVLTGLKHGQKKERQRQQGDVTLKSPIPTVPTQKVFGPPTWDQHVALEQRVTRSEAEIKDLREKQSKQLIDLLHAGAERESRIIDKIDSVARAIHARIDKFRDQS